MHVTAAMICDSINQLPDGRVNLLGGAPEFWGVTELPQELHLPFLVVLVADAQELQDPLGLLVQVRRASDEAVVGHLVASPAGVGRDMERTMPGMPQSLHLPLVLAATFDEVGLHEVLFSADGGQTFLAWVPSGLRLAG